MPSVVGVVVEDRASLRRARLRSIWDGNPTPNALTKEAVALLEEIDNHVRRGESFAFETTLSGLMYARLIQKWRGLAYRVRLIYLSLPNPELAVVRVANRVAQGGHSVPEAAIRRRFDAGWNNFNLKYKLLVNAWALYDNSQPQPVLIEEGVNDED